MDRSESPERGCVSMKSDWSMEPPPLFKEHTDLDLRYATEKPSTMDRSESPEPSCVSMKSDWSMEPPPLLKELTDLGFGPKQLQRSYPPEPNCVSMKSDQSMDFSPKKKMSPDLRLSECTLSEKCCYGLASVLTSKSSCLRDLNLSGNTFGDSGVKLLSDGLENPNCKLEKLKLSDCGVRDEGCVALASALRSNPSHLRELNLSENNLGGSGVKLLSAGLENPDCKLEKLVLWDCGVTDEGCAALTSALISNSHLRDLNLSRNNLGGSAVKLLSAGLKNPNWKLEKLRLTRCGVTEEGCDALASVLTSNSHLRDLNLSENNLGGSGVKLLSARLKNPSCKLETLTLWDCGVTDEGCDALGLALKSNLYLRDLDLTKNNLGDSGVKLLSAGLENPNCKLETLWLSDCGVRDEGCVALASALRSNPSHLRELNLFKNKLGDSGVKLLSALKEDLHYKLETLSTGWDDDYKDFFMSEW